MPLVLPLLFGSKIRHLAIATGLLAGLGLFAIPAHAQSNVQTYTNQALPVAPPPNEVYYNSPLSAGQLTLQDVLEAHPKKKPAAAPPLLSQNSNVSAEGVMLMQGMQSALQETTSTNEKTQLKAPQLRAATGSVETATTPPTSITPAITVATKPAVVPAPITPGIQYEPGQAPKDLASVSSEGSAQTSANSNAGIFGAPIDTAAVSMPAPTASAAVAQNARPVSTRSSSTGACEPAVTSWTKSCLDAGYPASFIGKIKGETLTVCPSGELEDVWVENSCTPPAESPAAASNRSDAIQIAAATASSSSASEVSSSTMASASAAAAPSMLPASNSSPARQATMATPDAPLDASCGTSNGLAASSKPFADLCASGNATDVTGDGPWRWNCKGAMGGMTVSCAAPIATVATATSAATIPATVAVAPATAPVSTAVEDGRCGSSDNVGTDQAPVVNLCARGISSRVSGMGPWNWACSGTNGGQAAACTAPKVVSGMCGPAASRGADRMPLNDLCAAGYASAVTGNGPWNWTCSGLYGGQAAMCSAAPKQNAVCGTASLNGHREMPTDNLCSIGQPSSLSGNGPWSWSCSGVNGGAVVSCAAPVSTNGVCGAANGVAVNEAPETRLCSQGRPTRVTGLGPWNWNCTGSDGGDTEGCVAPKASIEQTTRSSAPAAEVREQAEEQPIEQPAERSNGDVAVLSSGSRSSAPEPAPAPVAEVAQASPTPAPVAEASSVSCGIAAEAAAIVAPSKDLCNGGTAGEVIGRGPWNWTCSDEAGHRTDCSTLAPSDGKCGAAADVALSHPPSAHLCASGVSNRVSDENDHFSWTCAGALGGASAFCMAPKTSAAVSVAPATPVPAAPAPMPTPTASASAAASAMALEPVEQATCGAADGRGSVSAPEEDLCAIGKASRVTGKGPWHWSCAKGKGKISCEAPKTADGACGAANGSVQKYPPAKDLCSGGLPTAVAGTGPWLWTCVGTGGGGSASCSASSQAQTRVDGACGVASNTPVISPPPGANLCDSGVPSSVYGSGPWTWTCSGLNGGIATSCTAQKIMAPAPPPPGPAVNGLCGSSNGVASSVQPIDELCSTGTATSISGNGPWNWTCIGQNGGMSVSCTAPLEPPPPITGACGGASGVPTLVTPKSGLCSAGITSAVSGSGPWTWSCSGTNGGGAVACVAPLAESGGTGSLPSYVTPSGGAMPSAPPMAPSTPIKRDSLVTPRLPSGPLPPLETGSMPQVPNPSSFGAMPEGTTAPQMLPISPPEFEPSVPATPPALPEDTPPLVPPPIRDTIKPSPALKSPDIDSEGQMIPGNHFVLDNDISSISFATGAENIRPSATPTLDKLADALETHSNVRVTLTAYASTGPNTSPRDARRLSLARALAIRDYLTAKGISSGRIDVRALGANVPSGDMDRVDIKAN